MKQKRQDDITQMVEYPLLWSQFETQLNIFLAHSNKLYSETLPIHQDLSIS